MKRFILLIMSILFVTILLAQEYEEEYLDEEEGYEGVVWNVNINAQMGIPIGNFRDNLETTGLGMGGIIYARVRKKPMVIRAGLELSGITYDAQSNLQQLPIDGYFSFFELRTETSIFLLHGLVRIEPNVNFFIKPYVDGMFGGKYLFNRTTITDVDFDDEQLLENKGDWAFSVGGAIGFKIPFKQNDPYSWSLDFRCTYLKGTAADYLVRRDDDSTVFYSEPLDAFEEKNSTTDLIVPQIGITFTFGFGQYEDEYEEYEEEEYEEEDY